VVAAAMAAAPPHSSEVQAVLDEQNQGRRAQGRAQLPHENRTPAEGCGSDTVTVRGA